MEAIDLYLQRVSESGVRDRLRQLFQIDEGEEEDIPSVTTDEEIATAESELGFTLPPSYKQLVRMVPPHHGFLDIYGIVDPHGLGADIVSANRGDSAAFPPFLIGVVGCDNGDVFCFDTRHPDERGEYPIVRFDHEIHNEETGASTDFEVMDKDLGAFLLGCLEGVLRGTDASE
jgi:hypothetical protein